MTKLSDTQAVLLSAAAQRAGGSVLPLPASLKAGGGTSKALAALLTRSYAEERPTSDPVQLYRSDGDQRLGVFITPAGLPAIGIASEAADQADAAGGPEHDATCDEGTTASSAPAPAPPRATKAAAVLALLARPEGATLAELIAATGWLPHTTRAALTGLRKKGHAVERGKRGEATCYRVASAG